MRKFALSCLLMMIIGLCGCKAQLSSQSVLHDYHNAPIEDVFWKMSTDDIIDLCGQPSTHEVQPKNEILYYESNSDTIFGDNCVVKFHFSPVDDTNMGLSAMEVSTFSDIETVVSVLKSYYGDCKEIVITDFSGQLITDDSSMFRIPVEWENWRIDTLSDELRESLENNYAAAASEFDSLGGMGDISGDQMLVQVVLMGQMKPDEKYGITIWWNSFPWWYGLSS